MIGFCLLVLFGIAFVIFCILGGKKVWIKDLAPLEYDTGDIVLGTYSYMGAPSFRRPEGGAHCFVTSLRACNVGCKVVLLVNDVTRSDEAFCQKHNITLAQTPKGNVIYTRFAAYLELLSGTMYKRVLLSDVNDVLFQRDPFTIPLDDDGLYLAAETSLFDDGESSSALNMSWVETLNNDDWKTKYSAAPVVCAGTILGDTASIQKYLKWYVAAQGDAFPANDQGLLNVYAHEIRKLPVAPVTNSCILTCDQMQNSIRRDSATGFLLNDTGTPYHIVHQHNRLKAADHQNIKAVLCP